MQHRYINRREGTLVVINAPSYLVPPHSIQCHYDNGTDQHVLTLTYDGEHDELQTEAERELQRGKLAGITLHTIAGTGA